MRLLCFSACHFLGGPRPTFDIHRFHLESLTRSQRRFASQRIASSLGKPKNRSAPMTPLYFWASRPPHHRGITCDFPDHPRLRRWNASHLWYVHGVSYSAPGPADAYRLTRSFSIIASRWFVLYFTSAGVPVRYVYKVTFGVAY